MPPRPLPTLLLSAPICAAAFLLHRPHFYLAFLTAAVFLLPLTPRLSLSSFILLISSFSLLLLGVHTAKLSLAPLLATPLLVLLFLAASAAAAARAPRVNVQNFRRSGPETRSNRRYLQGIFPQIGATLLLALVLAHPTPWLQTRWSGHPTHPSQWWIITTLLILAQLLTLTPTRHLYPILAKFTWWLAVWWVVCPTKHDQRIPYGSLWIELACTTALWCIILLATPAKAVNKEDTGR